LKIKLRDRRIQIVVVVALALIVVHNTRYFAHRGKSRRQTVEIDLAIAETVAGAQVPGWASGGYAVTCQWGRDPFEPAGRTASPGAESAQGRSGAGVHTPNGPKVHITGIGIVDGSRFVLSEDRILRVGDRLGTGTIKEIGTKSVVVEYGGAAKHINID
jgi:hypothetical protein